MIKRLLAICCILTITNIVVAQENISTWNIREKVKAINKLELCKLVVATQQEGADSISLTSVENDNETSLIVYFDNTHRIRKFINIYNYPEGLGYSVQYFDEEGYSLLTFCRESNGLEPAQVGNRYMYKGKLIGVDVQLNDENDSVIEVWDSVTATLNNWAFRITCVDEVKELYTQAYSQRQVNETDCKSTLFAPANKGQRTVFNARRVNIRQEPTRLSNTIAIGGLGTHTDQIIGLEQTLRDGELWTKIEFNNSIGYVLAEYLEPVEQTSL